MSVLPRFSALVLAGFLTSTGFGQLLQSSHAPTVPAPLPTSAHSSSALSSATPATGKLVARVNGVAISQAELDAELKRVFPSFAIHGNAVPKEFEGDIRKKALSNLINTELAYQEAKRRQLQITPVEWQKRIAEIRKDYRTKAEFDASVHQMFGTRAAFEAALRHDMLLDKIFLIEVKRKAVVGNVEVEQYYAKNQAQFVQPESISFQTISAMLPKNATAEDKKAARQRLEKVLAQAKAAKNWEAFGMLAEKSSEDEFRVMMGEHKMEHRQTVAPVFAFAFTMKEGQISDIVESTAGFHIVRLNKHQNPKHFNFAELRPSLKEMLEKERLQARNKAFHEALRKPAKIEFLQG